MSEREDLINTVNEEINVAHPISFDRYDLCERCQSNTLQEFNVAMLRSICNHSEIPVKSRDKKNFLLDKLTVMISECECVSH